ncbi:hypothetical protein D3C71_1917430 [compost metagenome]
MDGLEGPRVSAGLLVRQAQGHGLRQLRLVLPRQLGVELVALEQRLDGRAALAGEALAAGLDRHDRQHLRHGGVELARDLLHLPLRHSGRVAFQVHCRVSLLRW